ncbi:MAG: hypothetical protein O7E57_10820 [Gammaproteobacteria bacterium]|nr:hypothetical protein [Gammaproteobacteria bacterium]
MAISTIGAIALRIAGDIALVELYCEQVAALPAIKNADFIGTNESSLLEVLAATQQRMRQDGQRTNSFVEDRLLVCLRRLVEGLSEIERSFGELLELFPYIATNPSDRPVRTQIHRLGRSIASSVRIQVTLVASVAARTRQGARETAALAGEIVASDLFEKISTLERLRGQIFDLCRHYLRSNVGESSVQSRMSLHPLPIYLANSEPFGFPGVYASGDSKTSRELRRLQHTLQVTLQSFCSFDPVLGTHVLAYLPINNLASALASLFGVLTELDVAWRRLGAEFKEVSYGFNRREYRATHQLYRDLEHRLTMILRERGRAENAYRWLMRFEVTVFEHRTAQLVEITRLH